MQIETIEFKLTGISPLIMHADDVAWADKLKAARKNMKRSESVAGDDRSPPDTWKGYLYYDDTHVVLPVDSLRACLTKAGAQVATGKGAKSFKSGAVTAMLFADYHLPFFAAGKRIEMSRINAIGGDFQSQAAAANECGFELFVKRAVVGSGKHVRVRPMFKDWVVMGSVQIMDDGIPWDSLQRIFSIAGTSIGLGDWRPGGKTPGPYGRFSTELKKAG